MDRVAWGGLLAVVLLPLALDGSTPPQGRTGVGGPVAGVAVVVAAAALWPF